MDVETEYDLKSCPFCDNEAELRVDKDTVVDGEMIAIYAYVECYVCGARGPGAGCQSNDYERKGTLPATAVSGWNERAYE